MTRIIALFARSPKVDFTALPTAKLINDLSVNTSPAITYVWSHPSYKSFTWSRV